MLDRRSASTIRSTSVELLLIDVLYRRIIPDGLNKARMMRIEIKKIGNSDGLILPRELMQRLDLKRGQFLHVIEIAGGGFQAIPYDPDFEKTMEIADEVMDEYKDTLAALAK
jgi:putative addiction module antidote